MTGKGTSGIGIAVASGLIIWGVFTGAPARQNRPEAPRATPSALPKDLSDLKKALENPPLLVYPANPQPPSLTPDQLREIAAQLIAGVTPADLRRLAAQFPRARGGGLNASAAQLQALASQLLGGLAPSEVERLLASYSASLSMVGSGSGRPAGTLSSQNLARLLAPYMAPHVRSAWSSSARGRASWEAAAQEAAKKLADGGTPADDSGIPGVDSGGNVDWRSYAERALNGD